MLLATNHFLTQRISETQHWGSVVDTLIKCQLVGGCNVHVIILICLMKTFQTLIYSICGKSHNATVAHTFSEL